jgi:hypothetical protein
MGGGPMHIIARAGFLLFLVALTGCGIHPGAPIGLPYDPRPPLPPSRLSVTLKTSWPAIRARVDSAIPKCGGIPGIDACLGTEESGNFIIQRENAWEPIPVWIEGKQLGIKGRAWRWNPVDMALSNNIISASLPVFYHAKIGVIAWGDSQVADTTKMRAW